MACSQNTTVQKAENKSESAKTVVPPESVSADTIPMGQMDGSRITLLGRGNFPLAYTETLDGYTVVINKEGIFEYAKLSKDGDLLPSGTKANDPKKRESKESKYVAKLTKHLRYQSPKLETILQKHNKLNTTPKKVKK